MKKTFALIAVTAATLLAASAWAQPKNHNSSGMREACAKDMETLCAGVAAGQPMMQCMMRNQSKTSDGCKAAQAAMRQGGGMGGGGQMGAAPSTVPPAAVDEKKPQ